MDPINIIAIHDIEIDIFYFQGLDRVVYSRMPPILQSLITIQTELNSFLDSDEHDSNSFLAQG